MFKLSPFIALFICLVYCNNENVVDSETSLYESHESQISQDENKINNNTFQSVHGHFVEETQKTKSCNKNKNRRLNDKNNKDTEIFELPLTATVEEMKTAKTGNKIITSSIHGSNYNFKNKNSDAEADYKDLDSKICDCDGCTLEKNKKVLEFESIELDAKNSLLSNTANVETSSGETDNIPLTKEVRDEIESDIINDISRPNVPLYQDIDRRSASFNKGATLESTSDDKVNASLIFNTGELSSEKPCKTANKLNTRRSKCDKINLSVTSPTELPSRRIIPGILENPTDDTKLVQDGTQANHNNDKDLYNKAASVKESEDQLYQDDPQASRQGEEEMEIRHTYFPNVHKVSNSYGIDLVQNMNINEISQEDIPENSDENQLTEPTQGKGIYDMKDVGVMLLENSRVCYACSTLSDSTCWAPDRGTTVKYCKKGHRSCLTKSFKHRGKTVIIRDCGSHCVNSQNGNDDYSSCSICHSDLCNGAASINIYGTGFAIIISLGILLNTHYIKV